MMHKGKVALVEDPQQAQIHFWREALMAVDYLKLKASAAYYGLGIPKGDRSAVVLVPGFLGCDAYLLEMYLWLRRIGYQPYFSRIGHNAECPDILTARLMKTVERAYHETGREVHLVGHSLGGVLSRSVAALMPDRVASVTMLGSPFRGIRVHSTILNAIELVRRRIHRRKTGRDCFTSRCACGFACAMRDDFPHDMPQTAVYTKTDGVVDWRVCMTGDRAIDVEVTGTHSGLTWNAEVFQVVAKRLASASAYNRLGESARAARHAQARTELTAEEEAEPRARVRPRPRRTAARKPAARKRAVRRPVPVAPIGTPGHTTPRVH